MPDLNEDKCRCGDNVFDHTKAMDRLGMVLWT